MVEIVCICERERKMEKHLCQIKLSFRPISNLSLHQSLHSFHDLCSLGPPTDWHTLPLIQSDHSKRRKKKKKRGFPVKSKHAWCKQAHVYSMQQCRNQDTFALFLFKILLVFYASHQHLQVQPPHVINKDSSNITQSNPKSSIRNTWRAFLTLKGPQVLRWGLDLIFGKNTPCKSSKLKLVLSRVKKKILQDRITERRDREAKEEVKEIGKWGKGGRNEGGGREKCSSCTLSFNGAKNFIPGKALFSFSLSGKFCKHSPHHSCCSHTHPLSHSLTCEDRRSILQGFAHPHNPVLPLMGKSQQQISLHWNW